jgi:hypothetical protein
VIRGLDRLCQASQHVRPHLDPIDDDLQGAPPRQRGGIHIVDVDGFTVDDQTGEAAAPE